MKHLEVNCSVRPIYGSLGAKGLSACLVMSLLSVFSRVVVSGEEGTCSCEGVRIIV
jgi:hypothetical protein